MFGILMGAIAHAIMDVDTIKNDNFDANSRSKAKGNTAWYVDHKGRTRLVANNHLCTICTYYGVSNYHGKEIAESLPLDLQYKDQILFDLVANKGIINYSYHNRVNKLAEENLRKQQKEEEFAAEEKRIIDNWVKPEPTVEFVGYWEPEIKSFEEACRKYPEYFSKLNEKSSLSCIKSIPAQIYKEFITGKKYRDLETGEEYFVGVNWNMGYYQPLWPREYHGDEPDKSELTEYYFHPQGYFNKYLNFVRMTDKTKEIAMNRYPDGKSAQDYLTEINRVLKKKSQLDRYNVAYKTYAGLSEYSKGED